MENSVYILGILVSSLYILFYQRPQIKEVTVNEFNDYVQHRQIKSIEITKDKISSTFFNVLAVLKDDSIVKLTIINHEQFLKGLETLQYDLNFPEKEFIPIALCSRFNKNYFLLLAMMKYCFHKMLSSCWRGPHWPAFHRQVLRIWIEQA